jgi:hypothetical protein
MLAGAHGAALVLVAAARAALGCEPVVLARELSPELRLSAETSTSGIDVEVRQPGGALVWEGSVDGAHCGVAAEVIALRVERAFTPDPPLPIGDVDPLAPVRPRVEARAPPAPSPWRLEIGGAGVWSPTSGRAGGGADLTLRYEAWGGRLEAGGLASSRVTLDDAVAVNFDTIHVMLWAERCLGAASGPRACLALGAGPERTAASAQGGIFGAQTRERWAPRVDAVVGGGWAFGPLGVELQLRGWFRPSVAELAVTGAPPFTLPELAAALSLRGFWTTKIF